MGSKITPPIEWDDSTNDRIWDIGGVGSMLSVTENVVIWVLYEGGGWGGCGLARCFLVALGGGRFAAARMSADDRGSMNIGVGGDGLVVEILEKV